MPQMKENALNANDRVMLQDLARKYMDICRDPQQQTRRDLWRRHNSLKQTRPLIYIRAFAWNELPESKCQCQDPFFRRYENFLRYNLFWDTFKDDSIFEPWLTVPAVYKSEGWGFVVKRVRGQGAAGSFKVDYAIKNLEDVDRMRTLKHEIDEEATAQNLARVKDVFGDIITINLDRGPSHRKRVGGAWSGDISNDLGYLRGIENVMLDMMDNPQWLHALVKRMSDSILGAYKQAEAAGDWGLCDHDNQAMSYAQELPDPAANHYGVKMKQLWIFSAAQELTLISPAMHEEFMLRYQAPIMQQFGLAAYGCCEDLSRKIDMLRQIPNLRRIAVSPFANVPSCAEQIGRDYVLSYRPSPADMVGYGFDADRVRSILRKDLAACRNCHVDITLKDVETIGGDPTRISRWTAITREVIDEVFG